jgi:hypothetical protein
MIGRPDLLQRIANEHTSPRASYPTWRAVLTDECMHHSVDQSNTFTPIASTDFITCVMRKRIKKKKTKDGREGSTTVIHTVDIIWRNSVPWLDDQGKIRRCDWLKWILTLTIQTGHTQKREFFPANHSAVFYFFTKRQCKLQRLIPLPYRDSPWALCRRPWNDREQWRSFSNSAGIGVAERLKTRL